METNIVSTPNNNNNTNNLTSAKRHAEGASYAWPERAEQIKRYKVTSKYAELHSPGTHLDNGSHDKRKQRLFTPKLQQQVNLIALSPITELAKNLRGAALNTPKNAPTGELLATGTGKRLKQFRALQSEFDAEEDVVDQPKPTKPPNSEANATMMQAAKPSEQTGQSTLRTFNSVSSSNSTDSSVLEEDYMALYEMEQQDAGTVDTVDEDKEALLQLPSDLNTLINGTLKDTAASRHKGMLSLESIRPAAVPKLHHPRVRRCLSLVDVSDGAEPIVPLVLTTESIEEDLKGTNDAEAVEANAQARDSGTPIRSEMTAAEAKDDAAAQPAVGQRVLRKALSLNDAEIMTALARSDKTDEPALIGNFSKPCALPLLNPSKTRHRDLPTISCETLAQLLAGVYDKEIHSYHIIDCRYPYEYDGGHINGADNLYTNKHIIERFPMQAAEQRTSAVRQIIVFHCEFSSERGPKLLRFLRNNDRTMHMHVYPELAYPELYLLHNGYKAFYESHAELCQPNGYVPMLTPKFNEAYRYFRAKSKSWQTENAFGATVSKPKKFRSRLVLRDNGDNL